MDRVLFECGLSQGGRWIEITGKDNYYICSCCGNGYTGQTLPRICHECKSTLRMPWENMRYDLYEETTGVDGAMADEPPETN